MTNVNAKIEEEILTGDRRIWNPYACEWQKTQIVPPKTPLPLGAVMLAGKPDADTQRAGVVNENGIITWTIFPAEQQAGDDLTPEDHLAELQRISLRVAGVGRYGRDG